MNKIAVDLFWTTINADMYASMVFRALFYIISCSWNSDFLYRMFNVGRFILYSEDSGFISSWFLTSLKQSSVHCVGDSYNRGEKIDSSKFGADPGLPIEKASSDVEASTQTEAIPTPAYRCKKCRRVVALQQNVLDHLPGEGETSFEWHKRRSGNPFNKPDEVCSSFFVEPLRWMKTGMEN